MYYIPVEQDILTREMLEFIAQQQATTQLVIILVVVVSVGGAIAFLTLRGGMKVFNELSKSIDRSNNIEEKRLVQQEKLADVIERLEDRSQERFEKTIDLFDKITVNFNDLNRQLVELKDVVVNNPNDQKLYNALMRIQKNLEQAKEQTDELEVIKE